MQKLSFGNLELVNSSFSACAWWPGRKKSVSTSWIYDTWAHNVSLNSEMAGLYLGIENTGIQPTWIVDRTKAINLDKGWCSRTRCQPTDRSDAAVLQLYVDEGNKAIPRMALLTQESWGWNRGGQLCVVWFGAVEGVDEAEVILLCGWWGLDCCVWPCV